MEQNIDEKIKRDLDFVERFPQFKKSSIAMLTYWLIEMCEPEDLKFLNIGWIARKLNISESYVSRCCKGFYNRTPFDLLIQRKMMLAKDLLVDRPELSIKEVAQMLDFCSVNYFINVFKKKVKKSPKQYRKRRLMEIEKEDFLRTVARKIERSMNYIIREETGGKYQRAVYVHGGFGKLEKEPTIIDFLAPGYSYKE
ncbi:MAG: AraC family transcriptional regulator [bacterium]|nr:AraC family transcriptional regulator [bacterium]